MTTFVRHPPPRGRFRSRKTENYKTNPRSKSLQMLMLMQEKDKQAGERFEPETKEVDTDAFDVDVFG